MKDLKFRTLRADEIEVRPATIQNGKATMLLYMDSRVVVNLLNETIGPMNWQTDFKEVNGQLIGSISIWDEDKKMWVTKSDTGSESNIEAQKGLVSDCYKRCLSRWGVDELYSAPVIKIEDDGYKCVGYKVSEIAYDDKRDITHLVIVNRFGKEAFRWDLNAPTYQPYHPDSINRSMTPQMSNTDILRAFCTNKKTEAGINLDQLKRFFNYWNGKIEKGEFRGVINPERLWQNELNRAS